MSGLPRRAALIGGRWLAGGLAALVALAVGVVAVEHRRPWCAVGCPCLGPHGQP